MATTEPRTYEPGLRAAGVERTRRRILDAARRHLVETGFHRLSLEDVAADAGVTRVTIYRHFQSKLGLLDAIGEDLNQRAGLVTAMHKATEIADPVAAFTAMVKGLCRFWSSDPDVLRRLISLAAVDPEAQQVIAVRERWRYRQINACVKRLAKAGRLQSSFDARHATAAIGAMTSFPTCDELATQLRTNLTTLDRTLLPMLTSIVRLD